MIQLDVDSSSKKHLNGRLFDAQGKTIDLGNTSLRGDDSYALKNIILYDECGNVSGFAEFKIRCDRTNIKVRYNDIADGAVLLFNLVANGETIRPFQITGVQSLFEVRAAIDAESEIFVCISKRMNGELKTLASGVVNEAKIQAPRHTELNRRVIASEQQKSSSESIRDINCLETVKDTPKQQLITKSEEVQELDEAIRKICKIDESGKEQCESCPYREHFFNVVVDGDDEVVV